MFSYGNICLYLIVSIDVEMEQLEVLTGGIHDVSMMQGCQVFMSVSI